MKSFLESVKDELRFVVNIHSNGPGFMWAFNARYPNDIERRAPAVLPVLTQISESAPFPSGIHKGTSVDVMSKKIGGDADDYITATYGIPSVTAEIGQDDNFIDQWIVKNKETGYNIMKANDPWLNYIYLNLPEFSERLSVKAQGP